MPPDQSKFSPREYLLAVKAYIHAPPPGKKQRSFRSQAEVDRLKAEHHARPVEELPHTTWNEAKAKYHTHVGHYPVINIYSHSIEDARLASRAAKAWMDANKEDRVEAKRQRIEDHAPKRKADLELRGGNAALERRCIRTLTQRLLELDTSLPQYKDCKLKLHIMCDGTLADVLYRDARMPEGLWLSWQHKTCTKLGDDGKWSFGKVGGYAGMLLVCECEADGKLWLLDGTEYDAHTGTGISKSTRTTKPDAKRPTVEGEPTIAPLSDVELLRHLHLNCMLASMESRVALPTTTLRDAEHRIGKRRGNRKKARGEYIGLEVERFGLNALIEHVLGGEPATSEERAAVIAKHRPSLPDEYLNDPIEYRLTRNGAFFKYPDAQQGKHDLEIWSLDPIVLGGVVFHAGGGEKTYQAKTPCGQEGGKGLHAALSTRNGNDGTQIESNLYKRGDADYYVMILPPEAVWGNDGFTRFWCIPEAQMLAKGYIRATADADPAPSTIRLYRDGDGGEPIKLGWTRDYHWSSGGTPVVKKCVFLKPRRPQPPIPDDLSD